MSGSAAASKTSTLPSRRRKRVGFEDEPSQTQEEDVSQISISDIRNLEDEDLTIDTDQMGKIYEKLKEPDMWPKTFSNQIKQRQAGVRTKLAEIRDKIVSDKQTFEQAFLPLARTALGGLGDDAQVSSTSSQLPIQIQFLGAEGQPYCNTLVDLLQQSVALIYAYDQLAKRIPQTSHLHDIGASFITEKEMATETIYAGKQVVSGDVEKLMTDSFHEVRRGRSELNVEEEQRGRLLLTRGVTKDTPGKRALGFAKVARDTEKAMEKLCFAGESGSTSASCFKS